MAGDTTGLSVQQWLKSNQLQSAYNIMVWTLKLLLGKKWLVLG